jgi:hypothetical protein
MKIILHDSWNTMPCSLYVQRARAWRNITEPADSWPVSIRHQRAMTPLSYTYSTTPHKGVYSMVP